MSHLFENPFIEANRVIVKQNVLFILICLGLISSLHGQGDTEEIERSTRFRLTRAINFKFNKTSSINASLQTAYKTSLRKIYTAYSINYNFRVGRTYLRPSLSYNYIGRLNKVKAFGVYGLRVSRRIGKTSMLRFHARLKGEYHSENQHRYRWRIIPSLIVRTKRYKIDDRVRLNFSAAVSPYYRGGGSEISQYDAENKYLGEFAPRGFHRVRYSIGAGLKYGNLVISTSILMQDEFNLFKGSRHNIHQVSKKTGKINHKINNYRAINLSLNYILNWDKLSKISDVQEEI